MVRRPTRLRAGSAALRQHLRLVVAGDARAAIEDPRRARGWHCPRRRAAPRQSGYSGWQSRCAGRSTGRFKDGMLPSDFFRRNVLSFQEDAIGIRLRDVIGIDNMMWGSDYPHSESTFPQSRKILAEILAVVPDDEQAKIASGNTARVYNFDVARLTALA